MSEISRSRACQLGVYVKEFQWMSLVPSAWEEGILHRIVGILLLLTS